MLLAHLAGAGPAATSRLVCRKEADDGDEEEARQQLEARLDEPHEKLTSAVEQLVTGEDWAEALTFAAKFRSRSFNNVLLIWRRHQAAFEQGRVPDPFPTLVAGYKQWRSSAAKSRKARPGTRSSPP